MTLVAQLTLALWLASSLTLFAAWCVKVYVRSELTPASDLTAKLIWRSGQALIWMAAGLIASGLAAGAAFVVARALGG